MWLPLWLLVLVPAVLLIVLWARHFDSSNYLRITLVSLETISHGWILLALVVPAAMGPGYSPARGFILFANVFVSGLTFFLALASPRSVRTLLAIACLFTFVLWFLILGANAAV